MANDELQAILSIQNEYDEDGERHLIVGLKDGRRATFLVRDEDDDETQSYVAEDGTVVARGYRTLRPGDEEEILGLLAKSLGPAD